MFFYLILFQSYSYQKEPTFSAQVILNPVCPCTSSKLLPSAIYVNTNLPLRFSNTASSVITIDTTPLAVSGRVHSGNSFISR
jgi:hypothetical protein